MAPPKADEGILLSWQAVPYIDVVDRTPPRRPFTMKALACFILSCWILLPAAAQDAANDSLRAEVLAEVRQYYDDFSARDWRAFSDHFWPRATLTTVWQPGPDDSLRIQTFTIPEFVEQAPDGPGSKPVFGESMKTAQVHVEGNLAQAWVQYDARFGDPGNVIAWSGIDAFTLMKYQGRWRIVSIAYASTDDGEDGP